MKQTRSNVGGKNGFSIERVCELNDIGHIIHSWYEVFDPDRNLVGTFDTIEEAHKYVETDTPSLPSPKF
jgi:hypothetical protein